MEKYIPRDALVAEIDRQKIGYNVDGKHSVEYDTTRKILGIINTLEVKEIQVKESAEIQHEDKTCKGNGDSLTQEPVSEVWHDAQTEQPQAKEKILATNEYGDCEVDFAINMALYWKKVIKWAYIDDLLNLSNIQRTVKNCKEPVNNVWHDMSEDAENGRNIIIIDHQNFYGAVLRKGGSQLRNHNRKSYVKWAYIDDLQNFSNVERTVKNRNEPVSDELEKAAVEAFKQIIDSDKNNFLEIFKAGAKWQKEQMMAKAVDGEVTYGRSLAIPSLGWVLDKERLDYGDKVKLIIIKED